MRKWTELLMIELQGVKFIRFCIKKIRKKFFQREGLANGAKNDDLLSFSQDSRVIKQG